MLQGLAGEELRDLILSVGTQGNQRRLSPVEVATLIQVARTAGESNTTIAAAAHLEGTSMIGRFLKLLTLDPEVQPLVGWGATRSTIGFSTAVEVARLAQPDQAKATLAAIEHGFTRMEAKDLAQLRLRSGRPLEDCLREIVGMRKQVEIVHVLVGHVVDPAVIALLADTRQKDRDSILAGALAEAVPGLGPSVSARLGSTNFVISADPVDAAKLDAAFADFEEGISGLLATKVGAND